LFLADEPVGAAVVYPSAIFHDRPHGNFDMYIVPRLWRHGLGSRLLAHLEQAAMARGYPVLETTVAGEDRQSTGFLSRHGFRVVGQSAHLVREGLQDLPEIELPEGYLITSASALDAGDPAAFYRETANRLGSYDSNYSLIRPEDLASEASAGHWDPKGVFVLLDEEVRAVGIIRATKLRGSRGLLNEIRLEPSSRGKGLGMAMTAAGLRYLAGVGASRVELDTTGESTPAHNMAMKAGFVVSRHWLHYLKRLHVWPAV
jgi:mycothiol synthase